MKEENKNEKSIKVPNQFTVETRGYINIQTKLNLYIAKYGCTLVESYLDCIPLRMMKRDGKLLGAYIENKICQEFKITRYELMESTGRQNITEARQLLCLFSEKYLEMSKTDLSYLFHKSRHFGKRMVGALEQKLKENHSFDKKLIERFRYLDALFSAYVDFKPIVKNEP